jgi:cytosine/adenosine deaminase-related metal-dependent hydrolase
MQFVTGDILTTEGLQKGYIGFQNKTIIETGKGTCPQKAIAQGVIIPSFVNAHTHIGDSFIRNKNIKLPKNIDDLVAPPNGLKHRLLNEATEDELIQGMEESIEFMVKTGTNMFCDFREGGMLGVYQLIKAMELWPVSSVVLSRPIKMIYDKKEVDLLLADSDGVGISAISDWEYTELEKIAKHVKKKKKIFAFHASEQKREDIDLILDLKPDFLIHMVKANESDLRRVKDENIPIVVCPRSNSYYDLKPDLNLMKKTGVQVLLGTDNAMLNMPNLLEEIRYLKKFYDTFSTIELLKMVTYDARKALNLDCNILGLNSRAEFIVLDGKTLKPLYISI